MVFCWIYSIPHVLQTEVFAERYCMIHSVNIAAVGGFVHNVKAWIRRTSI